jgi:hypothetical protein
LALKSAPKRRVTAERRLLDDDEAGALQMPHEPLCYVVRHERIGVVFSLAKRSAKDVATATVSF